MNLLSAFALIMLVLVGYSSGLALVGRGRTLVAILDLILITGLWLLAFAFRSQLGHWLSLLVWFLVALLTAVLVARLRPGENGSSSHAAPLPSDLTWFQALATRWRNFALEMGNIQSRLLAGFFYFIVVAPFGLIARLASDPLDLNPPVRASSWHQRDSAKDSLESARRQG
jgi:hypothetical protein